MGTEGRLPAESTARDKRLGEIESWREVLALCEQQGSGSK